MGAVPRQVDLEKIVWFIAKTTLEIERNLREPDQLLPFMPTAAWQRWQQTRPPGAFRGGAVTKRDLGPPHVQPTSQLGAIATITTRTDPGRWGALTLKLNGRHGRWLVTDLQRLLAARHYHRSPATELGRSERLLELEIQRAHLDREHANAALTAITRRLPELRKGSALHRDASQQAQRWRRIVDELTIELDGLRGRQQSRSTIAQTLRRTR